MDTESDVINWREYIVADQATLGGKPRVRNTRLAVEFILGLFSIGWTTEQILQSYPHLTRDALRAVFAYAADVLRDEAMFTLPSRV